MPQSANDRFTVDFEYVFMFSKSGKYYFKQLFEESVDPESYTGRKNVFPRQADKSGDPFLVQNIWKNKAKQYPERNKRCVWKDGTLIQIKIQDDKGNIIAGGTYPVELFEGAIRWMNNYENQTVWEIPTQPSPEAHFATFPEALVQPMIEAGCPEQICKACGKAREVIIEKEYLSKSDYSISARDMKALDQKTIVINRFGDGQIIHEKGFTDCGCNAGWVSGIVLDIFAGTGTSCYVAKEMGRRYIGIDLNPQYIKMAEEKNAQEMLL